MVSLYELILILADLTMDAASCLLPFARVTKSCCGSGDDLILCSFTNDELMNSPVAPLSMSMIADLPSMDPSNLSKLRVGVVS